MRSTKALEFSALSVARNAPVCRLMKRSPHALPFHRQVLEIEIRIARRRHQLEFHPRLATWLIPRSQDLRAVLNPPRTQQFSGA